MKLVAMQKAARLGAPTIRALPASPFLGNVRKPIAGLALGSDGRRIGIAHAELSLQEEPEGQFLHGRSRRDGLPPGPLVHRGLCGGIVRD
ncbi:hypothetical protein AQY21_02120 [Paracoccus sp. MKU1]|jgi:hypothetical protein|nr:hypothetical protein AQY21_02120 [Paracoccus sp. MKU1]